MRILLMLSFCLVAATTRAQTAKELIGKWKLVKETKNGVVKTPQNTFQVFNDGGKFEGIAGNKSRKGKWKLSGDNKELTIKISIISLTFSVDYFDAKRRVITNAQTGTLEYEKVED